MPARGHEIEEAGHRRLRVEQGLVHVDVDGLGAALDLRSGDLQGGVVVTLDDAVGEGTRTGHVGALADVEEEAAVADVQGLETGQPQRGRPAGRPRGQASDGRREGRDVRRPRPAAAADDVDDASATRSTRLAAMSAGLSSYSPNSFGRPALGCADARVGQAGQLLHVGPHSPAPRAQFRPTTSGRAWRMLFQKAATV